MNRFVHLLLSMKNYVVPMFLVGFLLSSCSKTGYSVAPFNIVNLQGEAYSEADLSGKTTVVVVWATWCRPCLQKIPALNALKNKYPDHEYWALSDDVPQKVSALHARIPFHWDLLPESQSLTDQLQTRLVKTYPQFIVLENGEVVYEETTESADGVMRLEEFLEARN